MQSISQIIFIIIVCDIIELQANWKIVHSIRFAFILLAYTELIIKTGRNLWFTKFDIALFYFWIDFDG